MFQTKFVEKIKTHILWSMTLFFFRESCVLGDSVEKYVTAVQATDENGACALRAGYLKLQTLFIIIIMFLKG